MIVNEFNLRSSKKSISGVKVRGYFGLRLKHVSEEDAIFQDEAVAGPSTPASSSEFGNSYSVVYSSD